MHKNKQKPDPKGRGQKNYRKMEREDRGNYERSPRAAENDISWYSRYPNLLVAAGSFPYPYRPGMDMNLGQIDFGTSETPNVQSVTYKVPGVMSLNWMPNFGASNTPTDPASIMGKEMYARVRASFSGNLVADAPDYVIYLGALDSVFMYLAWLKRIYRVLNAYTPDNYMLPDGVLHGMYLRDGVIQNLRTNKTKFWQIINELVLYSRKFTCPAVMDLMNRHYWMSDNVYTDTESLNSQLYLFNPVAYYKFAMLNMLDGNPGPGLQMVGGPLHTNPNKATVDDLYTFGRGLIDALAEWDDSYDISGYLKKAYEGAPQFVVEEISADSVFAPVYVPEVLAQIENARCAPACFMALSTPGFKGTIMDGFNVTQDVPTNSIISNPTYTVTKSDDSLSFNQLSSGAYAIPPIISIRSDNPTVADSVIASRLQCSVDVSWNTGKTVATVKVHAGTEIFVGALLHDLSGIAAPIYQTPCFVAETTTLKQTVYLLAMEQFDWHPIAYAAVDRGATTFRYQVFPAGDVHNITTISVDDLKNLHKICVYSELNAFNA